MKIVYHSFQGDIFKCYISESYIDLFNFCADVCNILSLTTSPSLAL